MSVKLTVTTTPMGRKIEAMLTELDGAEIWAGLRAGGAGIEDADLVIIAASNEFGTADGRIPERSFVRATLDRNARKYDRAMAQIFASATTGAEAEIMMGRLGLLAVSDIQRTIRSNVRPPNAPSTAKAKGSTRTLVDTGRLAQSFDHEVRMGKGGKG